MRAVRPILLLLCFILTTAVHAQTKPDFTVEVEVESAFTKRVPLAGAELAASVFIGERLVAIGRNADGTWLELQRPRGTKIGWLVRSFLEYDFDVITLPITDGITGLTGTTLVEETYGVSLTVQYEATLRADANVRSAALTIVPYDVTIPLLELYPDFTWVKVNYLGNIGWIAGYLVRLPENYDAVPVTPGIAGISGITIEIIPAEIQLAQVQRLREFVVLRQDIASNLAGFWALVKRGDIVPCEPPGFIKEEYQANYQDYKELPELRRYLPRLNEGIEKLNRSIEILQPCGTYTGPQVDEAYAAAINARIIFDVGLEQLITLEQFVIPGAAELLK
ncbi:MAG: hypothetical protein H7Y11_14685 [Armatimonadetes bacterium]|nr:hypothetical protein [Anaerolineae bacterium]